MEILCGKVSKSSIFHFVLNSLKGACTYYTINFGPILDPPPPPCVINIIMALDPPPPLKWWCNMWTEVELLDDFSDTFQIIKICFSTIIRTIFLGLELYSRILSHDSWRNSLVYSWFQVFYSNTCSMFQVSHPSTFKVSAHHYFALDPPLPPKGTINVIICAWTPHLPLTWWCNMCTVPKAKAELGFDSGKLSLTIKKVYLERYY